MPPSRAEPEQSEAPGSTAHLKTKVPPAPWPSTSLGLKETFPTVITSSAVSVGTVHTG